MSIDRETEGRWYLDLMGEGKLTGGWIIPLSVVGDDSSSVTLAKVPGY